MSEENLNPSLDGPAVFEDPETSRIRVIVEMEEGLVTSVHANRPGVEVVVLETVLEGTDLSDRTSVEYNGSVVEYVATTYEPASAEYDHEWESAILAGIRARATEAAA